jgi:hypothetical protein
MSIQFKKRHGPEVKCGGPANCKDCREAQNDPTIELEAASIIQNAVQSIEVKKTRYPILTLHAGTMSEGQVVFKAQDPDKEKYAIETPYLRHLQVFCGIHELELRDEVVNFIKSKLEYNSDNQSYSVPLKYVDENSMLSSVYSYVKQIEAELNQL